MALRHMGGHGSLQADRLVLFETDCARAVCLADAHALSPLVRLKHCSQRWKLEACGQKKPAFFRLSQRLDLCTGGHVRVVVWADGQQRCASKQETQETLWVAKRKTKPLTKGQSFRPCAHARYSTRHPIRRKTKGR